MARKPNTISILKFDPQAIMRLRVRKSAKGIEVLAYDVLRGPWNADDGSLERALKDFAAKHALKDDTIFTVLPRFDVTVRILTLPTQNLEEAASMVQLSAEEFVPYSAGELVIDQHILHTLPNGESRVLAALAHQEVVNHHLHLLHQAGLEPERIFLSTACLASAFQASLDAGGEPAALIDLAPGGIEVIVTAAGQLQYGRAIATLRDWSLEGEAAEEALQELSLEARGSLAAYRRESEDANPVSAVYVCSELADTQYWCSALTHETGKECQPAAFITSLVSQGQEHLPAIPAVLLGAALSAQDRASVNINLLPQTLKHVRALEGAKHRVIYLACLTALVLLAYGIVYFQAVHQRQAYLRELSKEIALVAPQAHGVAEKQEQLNILRKQIQRNGSALEALDAAFSTGTPGRLTITRFTYNRNEGINIYGNALNVDDVHSYAESLRALAKNGFKQLANARSVYWNKGEERGAPIFAYLISIPFTSSEDANKSVAENN